MTGPELLTLKHAGDSTTLFVEKCAPMEIGSYPEVEFTGFDASGRICAVRVPKVSTDRQLGRVDLTPQTAVGQVLHFSRDANSKVPSKPFWGITLVDPKAASEFSRFADTVKPNGNAATSAPAPTRREQAQGDPSKAGAMLKSVFKLQDVCFEHALRIAEKAKARGIEPTFDGLSRLTAQAMIDASKRGVI